MSSVRHSAFVVILCLVLAACGGGSDGASETETPSAPADAVETEAEEPETAEAEPAATEVPDPTPEPDPTAEPEPTLGPAPTATPEPAAPTLSTIEDIGVGPYDVGVQTVTLIDSDRDRQFLVDVWFPLADGVTGDGARYTFVTGDYFDSATALDVSPENASPDGPFPLVVYSHGSGGIRYIHANYTETLASHGYVVVAPDHPGNTSIERVLGSGDDPALVALNRPLDVTLTIDAMLDPEHPRTGPFVDLIDPEHIAVTGHSFGGFTTYAVASGYSNDLGESPADSRIDALIPLAPAVGDGSEGSLLSLDQLESIEQPTLIIVGTDDKTTPVDPNVETAWSASSASPHYRLELVAAEHQTFTDLCDYVAVLPDRPDANPLVLETIVTMSTEGCSPDDMAIERAQALTNTFAVTFLNSVFRDGEMFTPETHDLPDDIIYATTD